nr:DUF374 domain-containing protein [Candidatus Sarmatiella mevalonica]
MYLYLQFIRATCKVRVRNHSVLHSRNFRVCNSVVFLCWHCYCAFTPIIFKHFKSDLKKLHILLSTHRDARLLENIASLFGATKIIHYNKLNGFTAVKQIRRALQNKENLVLAPDGPRGPRCHMNSGITKLLNCMQNVSFVPIAIYCSNYIKLSTWDKMMIPLPFSTIEIVVGTDLVMHAGEREEEMKAKVMQAMRMIAGRDML